MRGRFNSWQKTMLQWNDLHPYSAVHVVHVPVELDEARLRQSVQHTLQTRGLTNLTVNRENHTYRYEGGAAQSEIKILSARKDPHQALSAEMEQQLNVPFDHRASFNPFRFFVVPATDSFLLGLTYFHPVADAEAVVWLVKDLTDVYRGTVTSVRPSKLPLHPDGVTHLIRRRPAALLGRLLGVPGQIRTMRQSYRPRYRNADDLSNGFTLFSIEQGGVSSMVAASKAWGVTVNDLLLALLAKSLSPLASGRTQERTRTQISIGCIVNLRPDLQIDPGTFGLFLGSFAMTHDVPDGMSLSELAKDIGRQTRAIKTKKSYLWTSWDLGVARFILGCLSPERKTTFYPKNYPLWGGITNMNLNSLWGPSGQDAPLDYFRGVSTGPATPLVLSVTTVGNRVNIGLSYRLTVFSGDEIHGVKRRFIDHLQQLTGAPRHDT